MSEETLGEGIVGYDLRPSCPICDWPLKATIEMGCVEGNCSYRPQEGSQEWHRIKQRRDAIRNRAVGQSVRE